MSDWMQDYSEVVNRLSGVQDYGNGRGRCLCPVHGDAAELSLAIGRKGELLMTCFPRKSGIPGCRTEAILQHLGLSFMYLFPGWKEKLEAQKMRRNGDGKGASRIEAIYTYENFVNGKWVKEYEVIRKAYDNGGKDFPQRRPNPAFDPSRPAGEGNPEYLYKLAGHVTWVLYRMKELRAALAENPERWVLVLEGEKDVETARSLGFTATCNPGGAGKWTSQSYATELKGCNVAIVPDEDAADPINNIAPGIDHARQVASSLVGVARTVRIVRLPNPSAPGYDLSDWVDSLVKSGNDTATIKGKFGALVKNAVTITDSASINSLVQPYQFAGTAPAASAPAATPSLPMEPVPEVKPESIPDPAPEPVKPSEPATASECGSYAEAVAKYAKAGEKAPWEILIDRAKLYREEADRLERYAKVLSGLGFEPGSEADRVMRWVIRATRPEFRGLDGTAFISC